MINFKKVQLCMQIIPFPASLVTHSPQGLFLSEPRDGLREYPLHARDATLLGVRRDLKLQLRDLNRGRVGLDYHPTQKLRTCACVCLCVCVCTCTCVHVCVCVCVCVHVFVYMCVCVQ